MTSPPAPLRIVALVLEPDRDAVAREAPQVLLQAVVELPCPLAPQEVPDRLAPFEELLAVAPLGVLRVGKRYLLGVAGVPGILGRLDLLSRRLLVEGWYGRSDALVLPALLHVLLHSLHSALMLAAYDSYADATAALGPSTRVRSISVGMLRCRGAAWRFTWAPPPVGIISRTTGMITSPPPWGARDGNGRRNRDTALVLSPANTGRR